MYLGVPRLIWKDLKITLLVYGKQIKHSFANKFDTEKEKLHFLDLQVLCQMKSVSLVLEVA